MTAQTELFTDTDGRACVRWLTDDTVNGVAAGSEMLAHETGSPCCGAPFWSGRDACYYCGAVVIPSTSELGTEKVTYERLAAPARLYRDLEDCLRAVDGYLGALYPDNWEEPTPNLRMDALSALEEIERLARELHANIEGR